MTDEGMEEIRRSLRIQQGKEISPEAKEEEEITEESDVARAVPGATQETRVWYKGKLVPIDQIRK